jgi:hypothetical protein
MFSTTEHIYRCRKIVQDILKKEGISIREEKLDEIVTEILKIIYSTGGDYSDKSLEAYTEMYLRDNLTK